MKTLFRGFTLAAFLAGFACVNPGLHASPIMFTFNGTFSSAVSGTDPFALAGQSFTLTNTLDTNAVPTSVNGSADTYTTTVALTSTFPLLGLFTFTDANATVTLAPPGTVDLAMNIPVLGLSIPVSASINIPLTSAVPTALVTTQVTGTASYGSADNVTTFEITGTLSTNPAGTTGGGGGSEVPEPASVVLAISGLLGLVIIKKGHIRGQESALKGY